MSQREVRNLLGEPDYISDEDDEMSDIAYYLVWCYGDVKITMI